MVRSAAAALTPAGLAVLIRVIGRYALLPVYRDAVFGWSTGGRAPRAAAAEVLAGLDPAVFGEGLRGAYAAASPKQRATLVGFAVGRRHAGRSGHPAMVGHAGKQARES